MTTLSVVIVSWNVRDLLRRCLESVTRSAQESDLSCQVIVVDSASSDGSQAMVRESFPGVELVACESNIGFVKGNNVGVSRSGGRYILLLNPDTEVLGDALAQMVSYMDAHPDVGALGPRLLDAQGQIQSSRR
ncbi:MAG TPA: glycosyltransferase, partial [Anaerolineae bacterium]|nr:glycosyltransferase [Anaerolineae bacterium]